MTEVPEYLLRRSKERREAHGLAPADGGSDEGATPAAPAEPAGASEAAAPAAAAAPVATAEAPAPAPASTEQLPAYMPDPGPRSGIPVWMMPVLVILPLWAIIYAGAFGAQKTAAGPPNGATLYQSKGCGGCHGAQGQGAVGPALAKGESKVTFPNEADHIAWVENGSAGNKGKPYGDPARAGGPRMSGGGMPAFKGSMTPEEIKAVVTYEREQL